MKIGVLGTGMVGNAIANKLVQLGHDVKMGSRSKDNPKALEWVKAAGAHASQGAFEDAAAFGEILFNCTSGMGALDALKQAGEKNISGKVLVDISNPLDFSKGMPPTLFVANNDSLGEQIQRAFPSLKVVKTLNTVNCDLMVNPQRLKGGDHDMFMCGNDADAKTRVASILREWFGWKHLTDLGDITQSRGTEAYLLLWVRLYGALQSPEFNVKVVR